MISYKKIIQNRIGYIFFIFMLLVIHCQNDRTTSSIPPVNPDDYPDSEGWNQTIVSTNKGKVNAIIEYGHMARFSQRQMAYFNEGVKVDFYDADGVHKSTVTADSGIFNEKSNDVEAIGHVVVESDSGVTLYTHRIQWDQKNEKILSNEKVQFITEEGDTLYGDHFKSDPELKNWKINRIKGDFHKGLDLSTDRWQKERIQKTDSSSVSDTLLVAEDSLTNKNTVSDLPDSVVDKPPGQ